MTDGRMKTAIRARPNRILSGTYDDSMKYKLLIRYRRINYIRSTGPRRSYARKPETAASVQ